MRHVCADGISDLSKRLAVGGVDAVEQAHAVLRHIGHVGKSAVHSSIMAVIEKTIVNGCVITQPVPRFQPLLRLPSARRNLHAIDVRHGHNLHPADSAAVEIKLHVGGHVVG